MGYVNMKFYLDENNKITSYVVYCSNYDELDLPEYNGEIPEKFEEECQFYSYIDNKLVFNEELKNQAILKQNDFNEIFDIERWFVWYDNQCAQYGRAIRRGETFDRNIEELDAEAEIKSVRLAKLRAKYEIEENSLELF